MTDAEKQSSRELVDGEAERKPNEKRSEMQVLLDRAKILELSLKGWQQQHIAHELNMSPAMVSRDMKAIREQLKEQTLDDAEIAKNREKRRLEMIIYELWQAWEQSKKPVTTTVKSAQEEKGSRAQIKTQQKTGDPRYMALIIEASKEIRKLEGLDAPTKISSTDPSGNNQMPLFQVQAIDYRVAIAALAPGGEGE
jgi:predicted transcriptional regulator